MTRPSVWYFGAAGAVSFAVFAVGRILAGPAGSGGVGLGVAIAAVQVGASWLLAHVLFPRQRFLAYGLGMLLRLGLVAGTALVLVPVSGIAAAPTLFALVSVLCLLAVLEPVFFAVQPGKLQV